MLKKMKISMAMGLLFAGLFGGVVGATVPSGQVSAACGDGILGIPAWYKGITVSDTDCAIKAPDKTDEGLTKFIWTIGLNVVEIVLRAIAYISVIFIIYGGFLYIVSNGSTGGDGKAGGTAKAIKTILNASVGLAIALSAVAIKNFAWTLIVSGSNEYGIPERDAGEILVAALNMAYFIAGALAVVMVIVGGLNYTLSSGDSAKVAKAKNTVLYAIIGLVVIIFAFAITTFINQRF